ncbi:GPBP1 protein, partial [Amia calva]|nr:GPBP1 protein [Amia calva]
MKFNVDKCKVLHAGNKNVHYNYIIGGIELDEVSHEKDLGVYVDSSLSPSKQCGEAIKKANRMSGYIVKSAELRTRAVMFRLYNALVRAHLPSLNCEKQPEASVRLDNRGDVNRRRHNSSDGFESTNGRSGGGQFGACVVNKPCSEAAAAGERPGVSSGVNSRGGYHGGVHSRSRAGGYHGGKGKVLHESNSGENGNGKKEERDRRKQFEAEDFPSLNPEAEREVNQNKAVAVGVWEHPPNPKSRTSKMMVIKKVSKEEQGSGYPAAGPVQPTPSKNGTGPPAFKVMAPKPAGALPVKVRGEELAANESVRGIADLAATRGVSCSVSRFVLFQGSRSSSSSPVDKMSQPRLMKLTRVRTDKKSEFLKALKQDKVDGDDLEDRNQHKGDQTLNMQNGNNSQRQRDENLNSYAAAVPRENGSVRGVTPQILRSSALPQAHVLSSSLEAEHRLLKEMGWQEESENDETCAPLTEDEMREFQAISEQLQKNGLRKNGFLKNGLSSDFLGAWRNSAFKPDYEETETSSSDTSDDEA